MYNPIIVVGIFLQSLVQRASRTAGAIVGFLITTVLLLWGLAAYAGGDYITLFGIELSRSVFIGLCAVWYIVDAGQLSAARKQEAEIQI
ncbi:MAG: hypothetical protein NT169_22770 [Chloroflexi bacterium]|nr:hypothetical protein [Chloroflexota bacterium]